MRPSDLRTTLRTLAGTRRLLVAVDFDGTLAPIVDDPSAARPLPEAVRALRGLAALPATSVVAISGRGLADLAEVSGLPAEVRLVGSHGAELVRGAVTEQGGLTTEQRRRYDLLRAALDELVAGRPGASLELKPAGIAVHVRRAGAEVGGKVLAAVRSGPMSWDGVDATEGKAVIDLSVVPTGKGHALDALRAETGATGVLFAGDDVTDEKAFARLGPDDVGVKVGDGDTAARYRVDEPADVPVLLELLLTARQRRCPV